MGDATRLLTEADYARGFQCAKRMWLDASRASQLHELIWDSELRARQRSLFIGAEGSTEPHTDLRGIRSECAIFDQTVEYGGISVRPDVLTQQEDGTWSIYALVVGTKIPAWVKDRLALQWCVLVASGINVCTALGVHVDRSYVRGELAIDWTRLFAVADCTDDVRERLSKTEGRAKQLLSALNLPDVPLVEAGAHCFTPDCDHFPECAKGKPTDWTMYLPHLSPNRVGDLKAMGIEAISQIPDDYPLSQRQLNIRKAIQTNASVTTDALAKHLGRFNPPAVYLDFEALAPAIPMYAGTRPYETIPFQWSIHIVDRAGEIDHREFLADPHADPRTAFLETLIDAVAGTTGPIIVYSPYEATQLRALARVYPAKAEAIAAILARLSDLLPVVRETVYAPTFEFSSSIKFVAPALCPDVTYGDLAVSDGRGAADAFIRLVHLDSSDAAELRRTLLAYCERDTWAMVRVHQALIDLATR